MTMEIERIFETWYDRVYSFTLFRVGNTYDAEDITSEVFVRAAKSLWRYNPEKAGLSTWLFTIALNEIRRHCKKRRDEAPLEHAEDLPSPDTAQDSVLANEQTKALSAALARLDERQRTVVLLRYYSEMSSREIAHALKLTETNVSTILSRGIKNLKNLLEKCDEIDFAGYKVIEAGERTVRNG